MVEGPAKHHRAWFPVYVRGARIVWGRRIWMWEGGRCVQLCHGFRSSVLDAFLPLPYGPPMSQGARVAC